MTKILRATLVLVFIHFNGWAAECDSALSEPQAYMARLVAAGGGQIRDRLYVTAPGVMLLAQSQPKMAVGSATFLLSGLALETALEFVAHGEAQVARLSSSGAAMNAPLYQVERPNLAAQIRRLEKISALAPKPAISYIDNQHINSHKPGSRATALTYTMTLENFHKLFIGRLPLKGNESMVRQIAWRMCERLHDEYPETILPCVKYYNLGNQAKSIPRSPTFDNLPPGEVIARTELTAEAHKLFEDFAIDRSQTSADQLSEFNARLTYFKFAQTPASATAYTSHILKDLAHLSVAASHRVTLALNVSPEASVELRVRAAQLKGAAHVVDARLLLDLDLKAYANLLRGLRASPSPELVQIARRIAAHLHKESPTLFAAPKKQVVFIGAPGSGKGTQTKLLKAKLGLATISSGDLLRGEVAKQTELGQLAQGFMARGEMFPDVSHTMDLFLKRLEERLREPDCRDGFMLDGFPRSLAQAEALKGVFEKLQLRLDGAVFLDVDDETVLQRLLKRGRADDTPGVIRDRLSDFKKLTVPLADYYQAQGNLLRLNAGASDPSAVAQKIEDWMQ